MQVRFDLTDPQAGPFPADRLRASDKQERSTLIGQARDATPTGEPLRDGLCFVLPKTNDPPSKACP